MTASTMCVQVDHYPASLPDFFSERGTPTTLAVAAAKTAAALAERRAAGTAAGPPPYTIWRVGARDWQDFRQVVDTRCATAVGYYQ